MRIGSPVESLCGLECSSPPYHHDCLGRTLCCQSNNDPLHFCWSSESVFSTGILTSRHHEPRALDQFASDFELDEKQAFLSFVRKGHVFASRDLAYGVAPFAADSDGQRAVGVKDEFVGRIVHRTSVLKIE